MRAGITRKALQAQEVRLESSEPFSSRARAASGPDEGPLLRRWQAAPARSAHLVHPASFARSPPRQTWRSVAAVDYSAVRLSPVGRPPAHAYLGSALGGIDGPTDPMGLPSRSLRAGLSHCKTCGRTGRTQLGILIRARSAHRPSTFPGSLGSEHLLSSRRLGVGGQVCPLEVRSVSSGEATHNVRSKSGK